MAQQHISKKYDFNTIAGGVLALISDKSKLEKNYKYLDTEYVYYNDESENVKLLRSLINVVKKAISQSQINQIDATNMTNLIKIMYEGSLECDKVVEFWHKIKADPDIRAISSSPASFQSFLDYLKVLQVAKFSGIFNKHYQSGDIGRASNELNQLIGTIQTIGDDGQISILDAEHIERKLQDWKNEGMNRHKYFFLDCPTLDDSLGGFAPQTLNVFISPTNGGKSAMAHNLVRLSIKQKKRVFMACVEDREMSATHKLIATLTGINIGRLKEDKEFTGEEIDKIRRAIEDVKRYVHIEFIYNQGVETVHKIADEYDLECDRLGISRPEVNIVDYTGHIAHSSFGEKGYEKMKSAYAARKNYALSRKKICFDFAQINREGAKSLDAEKILTHNDLAGAFDIAQVCDNIISINRNAQDRTEHTAKLHVCKARDGAAGMTVCIGTDLGKMRYNFEVSSVYSAGADSKFKSDKVAGLDGSSGRRF